MILFSKFHSIVSSHVMPHVSWSEANFLRQTLEDITVLHIDNLLGQIHGYVVYMYDGFLIIFTLSNLFKFNI